MALNYLQGMAGRFGRGANTLGTMEDPRARFAQQLAAEGMDTSPAFVGEGISRLGKALVGALLAKRSMEDRAEASKWLTAKMPEGRTPRQPTEAEAFAADPELELLRQHTLRPRTPGVSQLDDVLRPDTDDVLMKTGGIPKTLAELNALNYLQEQHKEFPEQTEFTRPDTGKTATATAEDWTTLPGEIDEKSRKFAEQMEGARQASMKFRPRDYAQELATGMEDYRSDPLHQISDPYTRMEWLRESAQGKEANPFVSRMLENLMFADMQQEIAKEDIESARGFKTSEADRAFERQKELKQMELDAKDTRTPSEKDFERAQKDPGFQKWKEKFASTKLPAAAIQYWNQRKKMIQNNATPEDLARFDSYVRADKVIDRGGDFQIRSGVAPAVSTPTTIEKTVPPQQTPEHLGAVEQEKAERKIEGEKIAEARWDAPKAKREVESMLSLLDQIYKRGPDGDISFTHPGFEGVIGATWLPGRRFLHGSQQFAMDKLVKQVKDKNFLQAFQALKGGGHITEIEGDKATDSIAAIHIGMPEPDFIVELEKVRSVLMKGLALAKDKMTGTMQSKGGDRRGGGGKVRVPSGWDAEDWKYLNDEEKKAAWGERK